jgi:DNA-3-methyladenine glycosylase
MRLPKSFFNHPAPTLARSLLGVTLVRIIDNTRLAGIIVETEAYLGPEDRAAHTFGGRKTPRVASMWKTAGTLYVYFTYGMHHCMNIVAGPDHTGHAVLIRALQPLDGIPQMRLARPRITHDKDLASGPAKACQALSVNRSQDGIDLTQSDALWLEKTPTRLASTLQQYPIKTGPRIGIDYAQEWTHKPLRFALAGHPCLSKPLPPTPNI